jgi:hypothetical protein
VLGVALEERSVFSEAVVALFNSVVVIVFFLLVLSVFKIKKSFPQWRYDIGQRRG